MSHYKTLADGRRVYVNGDGVETLLLEKIDAAKTLVDQDGGKVFYLNAAAGKAITLPSVALSGFKAKFVVGALFATTNFTVKTVTGENVLFGGAIVNSVFVATGGDNQINFVATAESIGDHIAIESDGTNWYVSGVAKNAGGITFTTV